MLDTQAGRIIKAEEYVIDEEPYYIPVGPEVEVFRAAYKRRLPFAAIGPTGCGKTRFIHYMSFLLNEERGEKKPLFFMTAHEDLSASDLLGRDKITGEYLMGIVQRWSKSGGILYLDEIVEARPDLSTLIHPMMETQRRTFYNERTGDVVILDKDCMLAMSWNPGYQDITKRLKPSTRQRLVTWRFGYPPPELESKIVMHESGISEEYANVLVRLGNKIRTLKNESIGTLREGASTRLLIDAAALIQEGIEPQIACESAIINCLTEECDATYNELHRALIEVVNDLFEK